jgi:protein-disulfide isomerase
MKMIALLLALFTAPAFAEAPTAQAPAPQADPAKVAEILTPRADDIILGEEGAPLTIIEYSSLSCSHCATFHNNVLPSLKADYIDTGKLLFINRDFPLNAPALKGAMLVQCAPEGKGAKFQEVLFKLQSKWAFTPDYEDALKKIAAVGGLDNAAFDACMADEALEERVLEIRQEAGENLDISGTPSFYLNGEKLNVTLNSEAFKAALDEALAAK